MNSQNPSALLRIKAFAPIAIILIIAGVLILAGGIYWWQKQGTLTEVERCYKNLNNLGRSGIPSVSNPASYFCECMGGSIGIEKTSTGERGICQIESKTYGEWEYFCNKNKDDNVYANCKNYPSN